MDQHSSSSLFNLSIDQLSKSHLAETAKWARFLSIVGMIGMGLMVLFGLFFSTIVGSSGSDAFEEAGASSGFAAAWGVGMAVFYIIIAVLWFFPLLYLLRFANTIKTALNSNDQAALTVSFQNLKSCFKYIGIFTIILLAIYALIILIAIISGAAMTF